MLIADWPALSPRSWVSLEGQEPNLKLSDLGIAHAQVLCYANNYRKSNYLLTMEQRRNQCQRQTRNRLVGTLSVKPVSLRRVVRRRSRQELQFWMPAEMPQTQAAATIIALNVTDHGACSIGGEVPLLIYDAEKQEVKSLSGQGRAPLSQTAIDWYMENGIPNGDIKMAPVPSVVDLCTTTLTEYGTKSFEEIVAPTLALLDAGTEAWHPKLAVTLRRMVDEEQRTSGSREEKVQAASDRFYGRNGGSDIADDLEAFYIEKGGFLRKEDLAAHTTLIEDPVTVDYRGYTVCKCGTWTQGPYLCQALRLLEGFDLKGMGHLSADYVHVVTEAPQTGNG